ncbi:MAG: hypothetical protein Q7V36_04075, partial [Deltaproteobacteria bacterium]|nr:hypothetical protein [Deltaproteobacteria bacterium]
DAADFFLAEPDGKIFGVQVSVLAIMRLNQALRYRNLAGFLKPRPQDQRLRSSSAQIQSPPRLTREPGRREGFEDIFTGERTF